MKISQILLLSGSFLVVVYLYGLNFEHAGVLPWNEVEGIPLVNHEFEKSETIVANFKTSQAKTEFIMRISNPIGEKIQVFDLDGNEVENWYPRIIHYLDKLERDTEYELHVSASKGLFEAELVREKYPSFVSDYLPRHGINLGLIGAGLFVVGGIIFLAHDRKIQPQTELQYSKKRGNRWYVLPILFGIFGGVIAFTVIQKEDPKKAKECMIIGGAFTGISILNLVF